MSAIRRSDDNKKIKEVEVSKEWTKPENSSKLAKKDTDARWTKKNDEVHYGYKKHVKSDVDSKLITNYSITDASFHDSKRSVDLLEESDKAVYAAISAFLLI